MTKAAYLKDKWPIKEKRLLNAGTERERLRSNQRICSFTGLYWLLEENKKSPESWKRSPETRHFDSWSRFLRKMRMTLTNLVLTVFLVVFLLGSMLVLVEGLTLGTAWGRVQFLKTKVRFFVLIAKMNWYFTEFSLYSRNKIHQSTLLLCLYYVNISDASCKLPQPFLFPSFTIGTSKHSSTCTVEERSSSHSEDGRSDEKSSSTTFA